MFRWILTHLCLKHLNNLSQTNICLKRNFCKLFPVLGTHKINVTPATYNIKLHVWFIRSYLIGIQFIMWKFYTKPSKFMHCSVYRLRTFTTKVTVAFIKANLPASRCTAHKNYVIVIFVLPLTWRSFLFHVILCTTHDNFERFLIGVKIFLSNCTWILSTNYTNWFNGEGKREISFPVHYVTLEIVFWLLPWDKHICSRNFMKEKCFYPWDKILFRVFVSR